MKRALTIIIVAIFSVTNFTSFAQNIVEVEFLESRSKAELINDFGAFIQYGADLYRVTYETPDIHGELDTASGLFIYPVAGETLAFPMLIYQHGTVGSRYDVPSELAGGYELALFWAGVGYATTAADYLGLGTARGFHPYVHSETEASAAIDMHVAVKAYCEENNLFVNNQLFITGYSQGGHGAAAAQLKIQEEYQGILNITASAPMSGPYNISGVMRDLMLGDDEYFFVAYAPYSVLSYNLEYQVFDDVNEIFKEPAAGWIQQFYDEEIDLGDLNQNLINWLVSNFGGSIPRYMFKDSIITIIETEPDHPINQALRSNDLHNWAPEDPTRLYYCTADDQVPFMNSVVAQDTMQALGATNLLAIDVASNEDHGGCVNPAVTAGFIFFSFYQNIETVLSNVQLNNEIIFSISPNPAQNIIDIRFENGLTDFEYIELIDFQGKALKTYINQNSLDISDIAAGVYLIKVISEKGIWVEKILKQ